MNEQTQDESDINASQRRALTPGARESNAGDTFHILWAARRAVQMLDPRTNLRLVMMEGVTPSDSAVEDGNDYFLGDDLTEYYEGNDFNSATAVVISQLKYSTRHPNQQWSVSRLCSASGQQKRDSVIRRLADIYKGFSARAPREDILRKLSIRLVSNQPVNDGFLMSLKVAQDCLMRMSHETPINTAQLLKQIPLQEQTLLRDLQKTSGLLSTVFTDFLRVLDFSHCGEESLEMQRLRLIQEISPMVSINPLASLRTLCELIANEALPGKAKSLGLTVDDVLACLGVGYRDTLFPAQPLLSLPNPLIETADAKLLAGAVSTAGHGRVLAHGSAGIGKTSTVQLIEQYLPKNSVVVIYDCFGGSSYLHSGEQRHTSRRALVQLANVLAVRCGTPFLLQPAHDIADLQRDFHRTIEAATRLVAESPDALLVLVIDAADNAVIAAQRFGDESFVPTLWNTQLPMNCRLLMTSRSHRRASLNPPSTVNEYELKGFDQHASAVHLRSTFPQADESHCTAFHTSTVGTPRVQGYLLNQLKSVSDADAALDSLRRMPRSSLSSIFDDLWNALILHTADPAQILQHLATLISLARPVSISLFAESSGLNDLEAKTFCYELMPGLVVDDGVVAFR